MDRQRRQQAAQADAASTALHAALTCLNRGGVCREPLTPSMFARPNPKGLQAVLHMLHHRIRGAARTKKELQHIYPVLEPAQAREFKAAMQDWVRELGAAGTVSPEAVKYFVSAYQGSSTHRTVLMLLELSAVALAKDLGPQGPQATLPGGEGGSLQAALREGKARLDAVVAAMQRLKQLHMQAGGQLAGGQAASGAAGEQLAPCVPLLFAGYQAASRRGELVQELLVQGPPLTGKPEAVGPESWADLLLLATGRGGSAAGAALASTSQALGIARRLSNPVQEASNFAAEGLAADADVLAVHRTLVQRLAATGAVLQAAAGGGAAPGAADVRRALAEGAAYRESLMLSVRQELASAKVRAEALQPSGTGSGSISLLQLLPPSLPPHNPVLEGMQAAEAAAAAVPATPAAASCSWGGADASCVQALRQSMWQRVQDGVSSSNDALNRPASSSAGPGTGDVGQAAVQGTAAAAAGAEETAAAAAAEAADVPAAQMAAAADVPAAQMAATAEAAAALPPEQPANSSSCSKVPRRVARAAAALPSPSFADMVSNASRGLAGLKLLDEEMMLQDPPEAGYSSPAPHERHGSAQQGQAWPPSWQKLGGSQHLPASPCMAESCASASVAFGNLRSSAKGGSSSAIGEAAGRRQMAANRPLPVAGSPMLSAAGSFEHPWRHREQQQCSGSSHMQQQQQQPPGSKSPGPAAAAAVGRGNSSPGELPASPACSTPQMLHRLDGSILACGGTPMTVDSDGSSRRCAAGTAFALTPPRRLTDSPLPAPNHAHHHQQQQAPHAPAAMLYRASSVVTPARKANSGSSSVMHTPAPSPVMHAVQPLASQQQQQQRRRQQPGSPLLLASCLKPDAPASSAVASPLADAREGSPAAGQQQHQARWAIAAAHSSSPAGGSPQASGGSSMGRRRSAALHTTSTPTPKTRSQDVQQEQQQPSLAAVTPPRSLMATPDGAGCTSRMHAAGSGHGGASSKAGGSVGAAAGAGNGDMASLKHRLAMLGPNKGTH